MSDITPVSRRSYDKDRTVHGRAVDGAEIVRYDRAGKWKYERSDGLRMSISLAWAVRYATQDGAEAFLGKPGGKKFDAAVRRAR